MIRFSGYKVTEEIYNSENSKIFRANRESDNAPVVIKLLNREYPSANELSAFIREYEIMAIRISVLKNLKNNQCNSS